ncbi:hypothetical protein DSO57_1030534 [Entomophthora muscae]|nr:hypothetical protein DSO57_1030534 [Entomophthora muscae]
MSYNNNKKSDEVWDDWENAVDAGLEPIVPEKGLNPVIKAPQIAQAKKVEIVNQNPTYTEYVPPVRLLARPKQAEEKPKTTSTQNLEDLDKKLSQRQEDYQKARERIFNPQAKSSTSKTSK